MRNKIEQSFFITDEYNKIIDRCKNVFDMDRELVKLRERFDAGEMLSWEFETIAFDLGVYSGLQHIADQVKMAKAGENDMNIAGTHKA